MSITTTAAAAIELAEAAMTTLDGLELWTTKANSPEKSDLRMQVLVLSGQVLNRNIPPQSMAERDKAGHLYSVACDIK